MKSINPPDKVIPIFTPKIFITANETPANKQWIPYKAGAMNRKENSNGSVIPVKKAVKAPDSKIPLANTFLSGFASLYMA